MSWIKMRGTLLTNPKVIGVARALLQDAEFLAWSGWGAPGVRVMQNTDRDVTRDVTGDGERHGAASQPVTGVMLALLPVVTRVTVGALLPLWSMVNECASPDGVLPGADTFVLDTICGVPGIGRALAKVGWIEILPNGEGICFTNFEEHNTVGRVRSSAAKTGAERTKEYRERKRQERDASRAVTVTSQRDHREEKNREDRNTPPNPPQGVTSQADRASPPIASSQPSTVDEICGAIRARGVADANPSSPELAALIAKGVTRETFEAAADTCTKARPPKGMPYLLGIVKRQLGEAAAIASAVGFQAKAWDAGRDSIEAKARELGMAPWNEHDLSPGRENFLAYTERVRRRVEEGGQMEQGARVEQGAQTGHAQQVPRMAHGVPA